MRSWATLLPLCLCWSTPAVAQGPRYANAASRRVIECMVAAHGGLERWRAASTLRYDNVFFNPGVEREESPWWVSRELFNLRDGRTYHDWPLDDARLGFDGQRVWSLRWKQANPPNFMSHFFYYFVSLPWRTQDSNAVIGPAGRAVLPGRPGIFDTVRVTWEPPYLPGRTAHDSFLLFVERTTGLLRAYHYEIGYGAMLDLMGLPPGRVTFGPTLRIHDAFTRVDGLLFPARMHTGSTDGTRVYGYHTIFNYSLADPWPDEGAKAPPEAVTDSSSSSRAVRPPPQ